MINVGQFDPVAFSIFSLDVRWYALSYICGFLFALFYIQAIDKDKVLRSSDLDMVFSYLVVFMILGGRLGYVLIYNLDYYLLRPTEILKVWHGGMAFHGALLSSILGIYLCCRSNKLPFLFVLDMCSCAVPFGLFLGRIGNFINGELYGRVTTVPWGIIVDETNVARHPSQLYEAIFEGLFLWAFLYFLVSRTKARTVQGLLFGIMILWYSVARFFLEFFREPDAQLGYIMKYLTMGQILSISMFCIALGYIFVVLCKNRKLCN